MQELYLDERLSYEYCAHRKKKRVESILDFQLLYQNVSYKSTGNQELIRHVFLLCIFVTVV